MANKFQQRIDEELGEKKWNDKLSRAVQLQAMSTKQKEYKQIPVFVPFITVAMITVLVFLTLSYSPELSKEQAANDEIKFQQMYYSKVQADSYTQSAQPNLAIVGMSKTTDQALLQQLSVAFEHKEEIKAPKTDNAQLKSIILYDEVNVAYPYNIYKTFTNELLFEDTTSNTFYKYNGIETDVIFDFIEKPLTLKYILIVTGLFVPAIIALGFFIYRYYGVRRKRETFDHITLERVFRWMPLPYLFYVNFKLMLRPLMLTWWEIIVPFILFQIVVLVLMKQQKEPHPYIVVRMVEFCATLLFFITIMFML